MLAAEKKEKMAAALFKKKFLNLEVFDQLFYVYGTRQGKSWTELELQCCSPCSSSTL
jgi:hypothetical protein